MSNDVRKVLCYLVLAGLAGSAHAGEPLSGGGLAEDAGTSFLGGPGVTVAALTEPAALPGAMPVEYDEILQMGHKQLRYTPMPADPWGPQRMQMPTPVHGTDYAGAPECALNTSPTPQTLGIRLDTSYWLVRSADAGMYYSEHQTVFAAGATILPLQTPGFLLGTRVMAGWTDNQSMTLDSQNGTLDVFLGWRYKQNYFKFGSFWDTEDQFGKIGLTFGALKKVPYLEVLTLDTSFAWGSGGDVFGPERDPNFMLRLRRVEVTDFDMQIRVGKYFTQYCQVGVTGQYLSFEYALDEKNFGGFLNLYCGPVALMFDITGGDTGLRSYAMAGFGFGKRRVNRPQDSNYIPYDTVAWVSSVPLRDLTVPLRQTFTGPLPPGP